MMKTYIQPTTETYELKIQYLMEASTDVLHDDIVAGEGGGDSGDEPINFAPHRGWFEEGEE